MSLLVLGGLLKDGRQVVVSYATHTPSGLRGLIHDEFGNRWTIQSFETRGYWIEELGRPATLCLENKK